MRILYGAKTAVDITGVEKEVIGIEDEISLDVAIRMITDKYPALKKDIDDGDILVIHNGVLRSLDASCAVKDGDTVEFAPVILGG